MYAVPEKSDVIVITLVASEAVNLPGILLTPVLIAFNTYPAQLPVEVTAFAPSLVPLPTPTYIKSPLSKNEPVTA